MKRFLSFYFIPLLVISVIVNHYIQVDKGLSKWKGGGFGMYSEFHYGYKIIHVPDTSVKIEIENKDFASPFYKLKLMPNAHNAELFLKSLHTAPDTLSVSVWKPVFNPESLTFYYEKQYEYQPN